MRNKHDIEFRQLQTIGYRIRGLREEHKLTQQQFADALDVTRDSVSKWELGATPPMLTHILRICKLYNVDVDYLLGRIDCKTHDLQYVHDITGLSEAAITKLMSIKDDPSANILSSIITDREFIYVLHSIDTLCKANFATDFIDSVRAYYVSRLEDSNIKIPYMDSPDDIRAVYEHQPTRHFERIVDNLTKHKTNSKDNRGGK